MLAAAKAHPDEHFCMYPDPEFAKNPTCPCSGSRQERRDALRFDGQRGRGEKRELGGSIIGATDEDVRQSSSFVLSGIKIDPDSIPAPVANAEKLREGPSG